MDFHTVHEFRNRVSDMLRAKGPVVITRRGKVAGVFVPSPDGQIPADLRREVFIAVTDRLSRQRELMGITEEQIAADIEELHRKRRATRGGR